MKSIEPVPAPLIGETAWTMLSDAANDVYHPMRIVAFSTVDERNHPQVRLMILRGASREFSRIWFHTDRDSAKVRELLRCTRAAVLAYNAACGVQLQITGDVSLHSDNALAHDQWQQMNMTLRSVYGRPNTHGPRERLPVVDPRLNRLWVHEDGEGHALDRKRFVVIDMHVLSIQWLQVIGAKHWSATLPIKGRKVRSSDARPRTLK